MQFDCLNGQASYPADKVRILAEIGNQHQQLNASVHSRVAVQALELGLGQSSEEFQHFSRAIAKGRPAQLEFSARGADPLNFDQLISALDAETLEELTIRKVKNPEMLEALGKGFAILKLLDLSDCSFELLPTNALSGMVSLKVLKVPVLTSLPESIGGCVALQRLNLSGCSSLTTLPEGIGGLVRLNRWNEN